MWFSTSLSMILFSHFPSAIVFLPIHIWFLKILLPSRYSFCNNLHFLSIHREYLSNSSNLMTHSLSKPREAIFFSLHHGFWLRKCILELELSVLYIFQNSPSQLWMGFLYSDWFWQGFFFRKGKVCWHLVFPQWLIQRDGQRSASH